MQNYKNLKVWIRAHALTLNVYSATRTFQREEVYGLTSQFRRCVSSIPANIAEGAGKTSSKEFANFLNIALGSANESEYFLLLAKDLGYLQESEYPVLNDKVNEVKAMLISLIKAVRVNSEHKADKRKTYNVKLTT